MTALATTQPLVLPAPVVLFDLDGTLTDSATGVINGFLHAAETTGFEAPDGDLQWLLGPPMRDTLHELGLDDEQVAAGLAAYKDYYSATGWAENAVFDGIESALEAVRGAGSRLAVATSKSQAFAERILDHFGLTGYFEFIGGASDDGSRRHKWEVVAHSLAALGIDPRETAAGGTTGVVMVGDREHDIHGAGRFGIPTVFVEWGYGTPTEGRAAARTTASVEELREVLTGER
ncbi:HAD hydrolase-like protein [Rhodococcus sp. B50]|uniref:HAD hydrolase-like protein n=1 Tax=Rhodococcus sp. B50 TaxID=2682847 RepID=UPI001BD51C78|nr:HAD hydrolase-like protein [Rhodococcus sp. B50]MBS9371609.1 hypothetical protein [Rhodococcus sp. B50]